MRIGFFTLSMFNGGAERVAALLTKVWSGIGHEIVLFTQLPATDRDFEQCSIAREALDQERLTEARLADLKSKYCLGCVVFNDGIDYPYFERNVLAAKKVGLRVVVILHHTFNNWCYTIGNYRELGYDKLMAQVDAVVSVEDILALWWNHRGARAFYIPNPIAYKPIPMHIPSSDNILVWIGRIEDFAKRPELAIQAFVGIREKVPNARLYMLGAKTAQNVKRLMRNVPREIANAITFTGFVDNAQDYLAQASVNLFTSLTEVTVPQVILEAQALGVPTVAFNMPPLEDGVGGVVTVETVSQMIDRTVCLLQSDTECAKLSSDARAESQARAESTHIADQWKELLAALENADALTMLHQKELMRLQRPKVYDKLLEEVHVGDVYFTMRWLPVLHFCMRWRTRLNLGYVTRRMMEKLRKVI